MTTEVAGAISLMGTGIGAFGSIKQGRMQQSAYNYNAKIDQQKAQLALDRMVEEKEASRSKYATLKGKATATYAKAGVDIGSGSPLLVLTDMAQQAQDEQESIRKWGESGYAAEMSQSELNKYYGKVAGYGGRLTGISGFLTGLGRTGLTYWKNKKGEI